MKHPLFFVTVLATFLVFGLAGCQAANETEQAPVETSEPTEEPEIANPAAAFCVKQGNSSQIRSNEDGSQYGVCILNDGTECDEWAFYNGTCPTDTAATPQEVVEAFYAWYLDLMADRTSSDFVNPLTTGLYRDSDYLTADFVAQIDAELANKDEPGGGDPILLAQDVPVQVEAQEASINGDEATVVLLRYWGGNPEPSPMVVHLREENGRWLIYTVTPFEIPQTSLDVPQPAAPTADMNPVAVTQAFYDWYLAYIGDRGSENFRNPLVDKAYHGNPLLTADFIARVDETLASFAGGGYDPFLLAQDIPNDLFSTWAMISGDVARVTVLRNWGPPNMDAIFTHLKRDGDVWRIDNITPVELYEPTTNTPEGTVQMFYAWYTNALRRWFQDDSVVVDYHESDLLTASFKQHLDDMKAEAEAANPGLGLHYDPLLCAQDVPYHVTPDQALIDGDTAVLTARTSFANQIITIDLQNTAVGWQVSHVTCTNTPEATARAFYAWYLGYIGDRGTGEFRNPLADKAYRGHPLLSQAFVQEVDTMFDATGGIGHDPFLLAQDVPANFAVFPGVEAETAVVQFQFSPDYSHFVLVKMVEENGRWLITGITEAEAVSQTHPRFWPA
ncbi:MAG: DUF3828 domain-containing protein [Anaerolineaceae bacterium]|nr:DUF3828 domain-containing protein [Anaerolineaceae bacterium]